jgi:hypothetical protein
LKSVWWSLWGVGLQFDIVQRVSKITFSQRICRGASEKSCLDGFRNQNQSFWPEKYCQTVDWKPRYVGRL